MTNQNKIYEAKDLDRWHILLSSKYPKGKLFEALNVENTNMYHLLRSKAITYQQFDQWLDEQLNGLILTEDSLFLDEYWEMLGIGKFLNKPSDALRQYTIIKGFARAKQGLITLEQIQNFINDVFGEDININNVFNAEDATFAYTLPLTFYGEDAIYTVIVEFPDAEGGEGLPYSLPFVLQGDSYRDVIKAILDEIFDINFKIVYKNG